MQERVIISCQRQRASSFISSINVETLLVVHGRSVLLLSSLLTVTTHADPGGALSSSRDLPVAMLPLGGLTVYLLLISNKIKLGPTGTDCDETACVCH